MRIVIVSFIGYVFGCLQTSYLLGKIIYRKDIRNLGNGNAGASNATMIFGKKIGIVTALVDILKAILAIYLVVFIIRNQVTSTVFDGYIYVAGLMVIIGHNFPFYLNFKGGKGTASLVGFMLALDLRLGLFGLLTILVVTYITDYIAMGTVALLAVFVMYTILFKLSWITLGSLMIIVGMSLYKHYPNFVKIKNGTETSVIGTLKKGKS